MYSQPLWTPQKTSGLGQLQTEITDLPHNRSLSKSVHAPRSYSFHDLVSLSFCLPSRNHSTPAADIKNKRQYSDETEAPLIMKDIKASRIEFNSPFDGDRMIYSNGERRIRLLQSINLDFLKRLLHKEIFEQVLDKVY